MMIHWHACPPCLVTVHMENDNQSFCHRLTGKVAALPCCSKQSLHEGLILSGIALRNQAIDEYLSMTPINHKDKSSVSLGAVFYSIGDRQSPCMQTMSPICQEHNNGPGRPHLHHYVNNKCNWLRNWLFYFEKRDVPRERLRQLNYPLNVSSLTSLKIPATF